MCVKGFEPNAGSSYIISLWVQGKAVDSAGNYTDCPVTVTLMNGSTTVATYPCVPTGQTIDGWQRVEQQFDIPGTATDIIVQLANSGSASVYFDDVRIHPFLAGMTTTVYDPQTLLPMATHDGYNYTTFYGYDENLAPVRVRVETINGIQTVSESEGSATSTFKN